MKLFPILITQELCLDYDILLAAFSCSCPISIFNKNAYTLKHYNYHLKVFLYSTINLIDSPIALAPIILT